MAFYVPTSVSVLRPCPQQEVHEVIVCDRICIVIIEMPIRKHLILIAAEGQQIKINKNTSIVQLQILFFLVFRCMFKV